LVAQKERGTPDLIWQDPMGQILSRIPDSNARASDTTRSNSAREIHPEPYNRSSLAVERQSPTFPARPPAPRLVVRPAAALAGPASFSPSFQGLDTLTAQNDRSSNFVSFVLHVFIITAVLWLGLRVPPAIVQPATTLAHLDFKLYDPPLPKVMPTAKVMGGGGGGGAHQLIEPTKGDLPKVAKVQLLPAQLVRLEHPKLAVEPTMRVELPDSSNPTHLGLPQSPQIVLASQGMGSGSGFGHGLGGGIGMGQGQGAGPGTGGGYGGGVMSVGGGVSAPQVIHSVQPDFTEEARRSNFEGTVSIQLIVDSQGMPQDIRVTRHLGMGLDQKAIEAVRQYRFRPAVFQGHPVSVQMVIEVEFHLH
jgi:periplasmic protein TonB